MKKEIIKFLVGKTELNKHYNRDFVEIFPVEPGLVFAFYEASGELGSQIDLKSGDLKIMLKKSADKSILASGKVNEQGKVGNFWFKNIPVGLEVFAELIFEIGNQAKLIAKAGSIFTLGRAVGSIKAEKMIEKISGKIDESKTDVVPVNLTEHIPYNNLYKKK